MTIASELKLKLIILVWLGCCLGNQTEPVCGHAVVVVMTSRALYDLDVWTMKLNVACDLIVDGIINAVLLNFRSVAESLVAATRIKANDEGDGFVFCFFFRKRFRYTTISGPRVW